MSSSYRNARNIGLRFKLETQYQQYSTERNILNLYMYGFQIFAHIHFSSYLPLPKQNQLFFQIFFLSVVITSRIPFIFSIYLKLNYIIIIMNIKFLRDSIRSSFYALDLFGIPIQLKVKQNSEYHTPLSSIISTGIIIFVLQSFVSLTIDMFERKNPNIIQKVEFQENPQKINLDPNQYLYAVVVADQFGVPITQSPNSTLFWLEATSCKRFPAANGSLINECKTILMEPCASLNLTKIAKDMQLSLIIQKNSYCVNPKEWAEKELSFEGTPSSLVFRSFTVKVFKCNSKTFSGKCAPEAEVNARLNRGYVAFYMSDYLLNQQQQGNPFKPYTKLIQTTYTTTQFKNIQLQFRKSYFQDTEDFYYFFGSQFQEYFALQYEKHTEYVEANARDEIFYMVMYLDDREVTYFRKYNNILEIFGQISGLLEFLILVGSMFVKPLNQLSSSIFLANKVFDFCFKDNQIQLIHPLNENTNHNSVSEYIRMFTAKRRQQRISVSDYVKSCGQARKKLDQSIEKIYGKLDALYIFNKMIEIDKLKKILLSNEQQVLFNFISKPRVILNQNVDSSPMRSSKTRQLNLYDSEEVSAEDEIQRAIDAYKSISLRDYSRINENIFNLLDKDMLQLFENQARQNLIKEQFNNSNDMSLKISARPSADFIKEIDEILK